MKYMSYYEDSSKMSQGEYICLKRETKKEKPNRVQGMVIRKLEFIHAIGHVPNREDLPSYAICMRDNKEEHLYLEKKKIQNNVIYKNKVKISTDEVQRILSGDIVWMKDSQNTLFRDVYLQMTINHMEVGGIQEFDREVWKCGKDSCVVFDLRIQRLIGKEADFFEGSKVRIDCLPSNQIHVTYRRDKTIPRMIANILQNQEQVSGDYAFA